MDGKEDKEKQHKDFIETSTPARGYTRVYISTRRTMLNNFLGGLSWGFGTVLGATVVVTLVLLLLNYLGGVPLIGDFINNLISEIRSGPAFK